MSNALLAAMVEELRGIRLAIEAFAPAQTTGTEEPQCPHPDEDVVSFGTTNGLPDWMCKKCGLRTPTT